MSSTIDHRWRAGKGSSLGLWGKIYSDFCLIYWSYPISPKISNIVMTTFCHAAAFAAISLIPFLLQFQPYRKHPNRQLARTRSSGTETSPSATRNLQPPLLHALNCLNLRGIIGQCCANDERLRRGADGYLHHATLARRDLCDVAAGL